MNTLTLPLTDRVARKIANQFWYLGSRAKFRDNWHFYCTGEDITWQVAEARFRRFLDYVWKHYDHGAASIAMFVAIQDNPSWNRHHPYESEWQTR